MPERPHFWSTPEERRVVREQAEIEARLKRLNAALEKLGCRYEKVGRYLAAARNRRTRAA
jgi:predicted unusual protein kinase regulating ubiquinone biosynthesis (AarF/ABC1/UbiB family)